MMRGVRADAAALVATAVLLLTVGFVLPVSAQDPPVIKQAELRLWPEYDDPGLLVIFSGSFDSGTSFPLQVAFPIPSGARNIQATYQDASGTLINRQFNIQNGKLIYELPSADFHFEFYVDRAPSGEQRTIPYTLEVPYNIEELTVTAQQPARAAGFTLAPAAENTEQGPDGLTYHILNRRDVGPGEKLDLVLNYSKPDTGLTAPQLAVTTTDAPVQNTPSQGNAQAGSPEWLPWLLIGLGMALLAGISTYWILSRRRRTNPALAVSGRTIGGARDMPSNLPPDTTYGQVYAYCTNCGSPLRREDRFCAQCGAPRRS